MDAWQSSPAPAAPARPAVGDAETVALFTAHRPGLERYVRSMVRDPDDASDVCQEVFLRLLLAGRSGAGPASPAAWMNRVAHNLVVSAARRRQVAEGAADRLVDAGPIPSTEETVLRHERDATVARALRDAPPADRRAIVLAAQGYRAAEIGRLLGRTELATRTLLCRSRGRLRTRLEAADPA